jgi:hypothetical protein
MHAELFALCFGVFACDTQIHSITGKDSKAPRDTQNISLRCRLALQTKPQLGCAKLIPFQLHPG